MRIIMYLLILLVAYDYYHCGDAEKHKIATQIFKGRNLAKAEYAITSRFCHKYLADDIDYSEAITDECESFYDFLSNTILIDSEDANFTSIDNYYLKDKTGEAYNNLDKYYLDTIRELRKHEAYKFIEESFRKSIKR